MGDPDGKFLFFDRLTFQSFHINKVFKVKGHYGCVPDFRNIKSAHHLDLSQINYNLAYDKKSRFKIFKVVEDIYDIYRLRRLKEIAENNKHHEAALRFHADEHRAKRWNEYNTWQSIADLMFDKICNYGQTFFRPFYWWIACLLAGTKILYFTKIFRDYGDAFKYMLSNALPVMPVSRLYISQLEDNLILIKGVASISLTIGTFAWWVTSTLFIFLIILGLRNRFRV